MPITSEAARRRVERARECPGFLAGDEDRRCARCAGPRSAHRGTRSPRHVFTGTGLACDVCGRDVAAHRAKRLRFARHAFEGEGERCEHVTKGEPCGLAREAHRAHGSRKRHAFEAGPDGLACAVCGKPASHRVHGRPAFKPFLGVDGEGVRHPTQDYVLLCAADAAPKPGEPSTFEGSLDLASASSLLRGLGATRADGQDVEALRYLPSRACLEMLWRWGQRFELVGFYFSYDLTMILRDVPDHVAYLVGRPEERSAWQATTWKGAHPFEGDGDLCTRVMPTGDPCDLPRDKHRDVTRGAPPVSYFAGRDPDGVAVRFRLNHDGMRWTIRRERWEDRGPKLDKDGKPVRDRLTGAPVRDFRWSAPKGSTAVLWDVRKFFQSSFVKAIEDWKIGTVGERAEVARWKKRRSTFEEDDREAIRRYSLLECKLLAELVARVVKAHEDKGLRLKRLDGPGSAASAMMRVMGVPADKRTGEPGKLREPRFKRPEARAAWLDAVHRAFFGGRFENSAIGIIPEPVVQFDINSAYPAACLWLPCLTHGRWRRSRRESSLARKDTAHALVRYQLRDLGDHAAWGPFPHRTRTGSIWFPRESRAGGWAHVSEYLAAKRLYPEHVVFVEAWVMRKRCECPSPLAPIGEWYEERLRLGKDTAGMPLKFGMNSVFGKTAQSVGSAPFQNFVWAGAITAHCRAMMLDVLARLRDRGADLWRVYSIATDGITLARGLLVSEDGRDLTREVFPQPEGAPGAPLGKPLGGWSEKKMADPRASLFLIQPGVMAPLRREGERWTLASGEDEDEDKTDTRARGIGRRELERHAPAMADAFERGERSYRRITGERFVGFFSAVVRRSASFHARSGLGRFHPEAFTRPMIHAKPLERPESPDPVVRVYATDEDRRAKRSAHIPSHDPHDPTSGRSVWIQCPATDAGAVRIPRFGAWLASVAETKFDALPKRAEMVGAGAFRRLTLHHARGESAPYNETTLDEARAQLAALDVNVAEQPDHVDDVGDVFGEF